MKYVKYFFLILFFFNCISIYAQSYDPYIGIIPAPVSVKQNTGVFKLTPETFILVDAPDDKAVLFFKEYIKKAGYGNGFTDISNIDKKTGLTNSIKILTNFKSTIPNDGYELTITDNQITLSGKGAGLFYGIQTLIQLMDSKKAGYATLQCAVIKDNPRFAYRGMHLDVARHFFDVNFIKKYLDVMAAYKLNYFHWHLTDDQGWRIEIKKYPKLTEIGSKRAQTKVGNAIGNDSDLYDNTPYSGFYTQEEIKDIVEYADKRYITVVPEIEMPGHSLAAIASYPEMSCHPNIPYKVSENWGVTTDVLCPNDATYRILQDVLSEIVGLFPGKYVHIGGDECPKDAWRASEFCQQLIRDQRLRDENGLQSYFIQQIQKYLNARSRTIIGWDEILEGGLASNAVVMSWRGEAGGIAAAQLNHDVIMTPNSGGLYFDHSQSKSPQEPLSIGGYSPLWKIYNYDPVPAALNAEQQKHIIGVQANLWTEYIATNAKAEYMLLPRLLALAEIAWSPKGNKDYINFSEQRVARHLPRLDAQGYDYRVPEAIGADDTTLYGETFKVVLKEPMQGAKIYYTIDGYTPRETDFLYTKPITVTVPKKKRIDLQTVTISPTGKRSNVTHTYLENGVVPDFGDK